MKRVMNDAGMEARRAPCNGYANAREILPAEILEALQRHFEGGLMWVPARERRRRKTEEQADRNRRILRDHRRGAGTSALAGRYGLSTERIRQILRKES
jgi:Mor family transcriptional regulator